MHNNKFGVRVVILERCDPWVRCRYGFAGGRGLWCVRSLEVHREREPWVWLPGGVAGQRVSHMRSGVEVAPQPRGELGAEMGG